MARVCMSCRRDSPIIIDEDDALHLAAASTAVRPKASVQLCLLEQPGDITLELRAHAANFLAIGIEARRMNMELAEDR